jgi:hypothetical protein
MDFSYTMHFEHRPIGNLVRRIVIIISFEDSIMRQFILNPVSLGDIPLSAGIEKAFSIKTTRHMHGPDASISEWCDNKRDLQYTMHLPGIPRAIARFISSDNIPIRCTQVITTSTATEHKVENMLRVGMGLVQARPRFVVRRVANECTFQADVTVSARLLPPLKQLTERFMLAQCEKELNRYANVVLEH